jgi:hypothetical protein
MQYVRHHAMMGFYELIDFDRRNFKKDLHLSELGGSTAGNL